MKQKECVICGRKFKALRNNCKYCSDECRKIAAHFRNAEQTMRHRFDVEWHEQQAERQRTRYRKLKEQNQCE